MTLGARDSLQRPPRGRGAFSHGVRLTVAYDGTDFHGWQVQPGVRTVQQTLERALATMGLTTSRVRGASRTDAGVHARGQVAAFGCDRQLPPRAFTVGLNGHLPADVVVRHATPVAADYDPRHDTTGKVYRYHITVGATRDPLLRRTTLHLGPQFARKDIPARQRRPVVEDFLDLPLMRAAAAKMVGTHDFQAFRASNDARENTIRTLRRVDIRPDAELDDALCIEFEGTAFLKNMVRILVGTLLEVGRRELPPSRLEELLTARAARDRAGPTAPPHGLILHQITLGRRSPRD